MSNNMRSPERKEEIDSFISEFYAEKGPAYCSSELSEPKGYIFQRAHAIGVKYNNANKYNGKVKYSSRSERQEARINELMNINEKLRSENIKIIHENMKMKKLNLA